MKDSVRRVFSRDIGSDDVVIDMGAGYCEFIKFIRSAENNAIDKKSDTSVHVVANVRVINASCAALPALWRESAGHAFMSIFSNPCQVKPW